MLPKILAVDFDGTLCENAYPDIGLPKHDIIKSVMKCASKGYKIILWTCRNRESLSEALEWCKGLGLEFDAVNTNLPEVQEFFGGGDTRKVFADLYLDDKNVMLSMAEYIAEDEDDA